MDNTIEQQRAIYGASLAERFGSVMQNYELSQRSLARVLGISAPMLSQLISGRRIKIGNPAVFGRLLMLEARAGEADHAAVLHEVELSDPATVTKSAIEPREGGERLAVIHYLQGIAGAALLAELAELAAARGDEPLAQLFQEAATGARS